MAYISNAASPLSVPTHSGTGQPFHAFVIDFLLDHGMASWCGYRYWMVFTPFPRISNADSYEDPNVVASHDGTTWVVPSWITNPLYDSPGSALGEFQADPTMVYDPDSDRIIVYWMHTHTTISQVSLFHAFLNADETVTFDEPTAALFTVGSNTPGNFSPAVVREAHGKWHMWFGWRYPSGGATVYAMGYRSSTDGLTWSDRQTCTPEAPFTEVFGSDHLAWHMTAKLNRDAGRFEFLVSLTDQPARTSFDLAYAQATCSDPTVISVPLTEFVMVAGSQTWQDIGIYHASFVRTGADTYRIWYSGQGSVTNGVGETSGSLPARAGYPFAAATPSAVVLTIPFGTPPYLIERRSL